MPAVVLRHPELPGQPVVVDVPLGSYVPEIYRDAGWQIDADTTVEDAVAEAAETHDAAVVKALDDAQDFVPEFPPADSDTAAGPPADPTPAPSPTPSPSPEPVDTTEEN